MWYHPKSYYINILYSFSSLGQLQQLVQNYAAPTRTIHRNVNQVTAPKHRYVFCCPELQQSMQNAQDSSCSAIFFKSKIKVLTHSSVRSLFQAHIDTVSSSHRTAARGEARCSTNDAGRPNLLFMLGAHTAIHPDLCQSCFTYSHSHI